MKVFKKPPKGGFLLVDNYIIYVYSFARRLLKLARSNYEYCKTWRLRNPEKRNKSRRSNYSETRKNAKNTARPWSDQDVRRIFSAGRPSDRVLSDEIGRSVQAIQVKRARTISLYEATLSIGD